jgi:hypothetical protein
VAEEREEQARQRREWKAYEQEVEEQRRQAHRKAATASAATFSTKGCPAPGSWTMTSRMVQRTAPISDRARMPASLVGRMDASNLPEPLPYVTSPHLTAPSAIPPLS